MSIVVSQLYYYPVKSCRGLSLKQAEIGLRGFVFDRQWMLVDEDGNFISQREIATMSLIKPTVDHESGVLKLTAPNMPDIVVSGDGPQTTVQVWKDKCLANDQGDEIASWLSNFLGKSCRLVKMADDFVRQVDQDYATRGQDQVGFADGFPFLLISEASHEDLNSRLSEKLPINRFRPNIVVKGCVPFAEDSWKKIVINGIEFDIVKPCARCVITTVNQDTGIAGPEPLKTLAKFRLNGNRLLFGQNLTHDSTGRIAVNDIVELL